MGRLGAGARLREAKHRSPRAVLVAAATPQLMGRPCINLGCATDGAAKALRMR